MLYVICSFDVYFGNCAGLLHRQVRFRFFLVQLRLRRMNDSRLVLALLILLMFYASGRVFRKIELLKRKISRL
jgi:hypothetical protein